MAAAGATVVLVRRRAALSPAQQAAAAGALALGLGVVLGPVDVAGERRALSVHVVQHVVVFSIVPGLMLVAIAPLLGARREPMAARQALGLLVLGVTAIWAIHLPAVMNATLRSGALNDLAHVALLLAGLAVAWPLAGPRRLGGMDALGYLGLEELTLGALGILITWSPDLLFSGYADLRPLWEDPSTDQMLAGALFLVGKEPLVAVEVVLLTMAVLADTGEEDDAPV